MPDPRPISIAGGGLAGLTLGIFLRREGVPVTIHEAGAYPRHRVCGEFICGRGVEVVADLGLREKFIAAGAREGRTAAFFAGQRLHAPKALPRPALCLSRYVMDDLLAREFRQLGGCLQERDRVSPAGEAPGWVRATGRRIESKGAAHRWIGLKAHARSVQLGADLEMHFLPRAYVGLCRLTGGEVNVCGLFAVDKPMAELAQRWPEMLRGPADSVLRDRLKGAEFVTDSFCAVSALSLRRGSGAASSECRVGDALTMIPPVTGNGMSMAFESAAWAVEPLAAYSRGDLAWPEARSAIARRCDAGFARRLFWARWMQEAVMRAGCREIVLRLASRCDGLWRLLFEKTR